MSLPARAVCMNSRIGRNSFQINIEGNSLAWQAMAPSTLPRLLDSSRNVFRGVETKNIST